ncbi:exonuclease SbcCD subunit D C-terminal domain-containing protein [Pedobacter sp.]|uniref:exonuclease SbcCD subunit D C-terminal domain-containing protein n=1 Tax=Pedobacter sp. TaxID=1411316 RepID=UPI003D7F601D
MKILHTADWHLGKKLEQNERTEEHQDFLNWLIVKLKTECIDVLLIAGDIFDTGSPSNTALEQYYRFLRQVKNTCCREVIIIGGNHDSVSTLDAPKELLRYFNVHVVGGVPEVFTDQVIEIADNEGNIELVVCAVPFLRDRDIRLSISGETTDERQERIRIGIAQHYHNFVEHISTFKLQGIPVIATGHLFAAGSSTSDSEKEIHVGNLAQVAGDQFPVEFDYIALGHIHRPQVVNKMEHIRYCGSPIPLSFSENDDAKQVVIVEFKGAEMTSMKVHEVPCYRKLIRIKGNLEQVKSKLRLLEDQQCKYHSWVEIQVLTEANIADLEEQLHHFKADKPFIERFFIRQHKLKPAKSLEEMPEEAFSLQDLAPKAVFIKCCEAEYGEADFTDLIESFDEIMEQMNQREN